MRSLWQVPPHHPQIRLNRHVESKTPQKRVRLNTPELSRFDRAFPVAIGLSSFAIVLHCETLVFLLIPQVLDGEFVAKNIHGRSGLLSYLAVLPWFPAKPAYNHVPFGVFVSCSNHFFLCLLPVVKAEPVIGDGTCVALQPLSAVSASHLQKKVLAESKKMYVSSAIQQDASGLGAGVGHHHTAKGLMASEDKSNLARLARELSALSLAGNSGFVMLNEARYTGLRSITKLFEGEMKKIRAANASVASSGAVDAAALDVSSNDEDLAEATLVSGLVGLLESHVRSNPDASLQLLAQITALLRSAGIASLTATGQRGIWMDRLAALLAAIAASPATVVHPAVQAGATEV